MPRRSASTTGSASLTATGRRDAAAAVCGASAGARADPRSCRRLAASLGSGVRRSGAAGALLESDPDARFDAILADTVAAIAATRDEADVMQLLRRMKAEASLLIALADIGGVWPVMRVTAALTELADAAVGAAVRHLLGAGGARRQASPGRHSRSRRSAAATSCWRWARWARASSTIRATSTSSCSTTPARRLSSPGTEPAPFYVRHHARPGEAAAGAHRRRLRVPHRPAAASRPGHRPRSRSRPRLRSTTTRASGATGSAPP